MSNPKSYTITDKLINNQIYRSFLESHLDDGWTRNDKFENFEYLIKITEFAKKSPSGASCLDVGCGTGDLSYFLQKYSIGKYTGIDIFEPGVKKAREKYPDQTFVMDDFLEYKFNNKFDFVFCSGALTTNLASDNYPIMEEWIKKMWELKKVGVAFNFLLEQFEGHNFGNLFLYDWKKVIRVCKNLTPKPRIHTIITPAGAGDTLDEMHVYLY